MVFDIPNIPPFSLCKVKDDLSNNLAQRRLVCNCTFCHQFVRSNISLMCSTVEDWDYILELRNKTREYFANTEILLKEKHYEYLSKFTGKIWMVRYDNQNIGFLKLNGSLKNLVKLIF